MLKKKKLLKMIVGLIQVNDFQLLNQDSILNGNVCAPNERKKVREAADIMKALINNFDYIHSPEFEEGISRKSEKYKLMKIKLINNPTKKKEQRDRLVEAFLRILENDGLYKLIPRKKHSEIDQIKAIFDGLENP